MANLYWVYDIKNRSFLSAHEASADASTAVRKHIAKSGITSNGKNEPAPSTRFEVITVTR